MNQEDLVKFLKENLVLKVKTESHRRRRFDGDSPPTGRDTPKIQLILSGKVISEVFI